MLGVVTSAALQGITGEEVRVEVHVTSGFPGFSIVGLPDAACRESRDRVRAAFMSCGYAWALRKTTINLAPTSIRKGGAALDLAIAVGLLVATDQLDAELVKNHAFFGELGLDGTIRPINGTISLVDAVEFKDFVIVPEDNVGEAELIGRHHVRTASTLKDLVECLKGEQPWMTVMPKASDVVGLAHSDFRDVRGHLYARWALEVAAAGGHHTLLVGPPGSGKSMLARRLPSILPDLDHQAALETTRVHSVAGQLQGRDQLLSTPPLRAPHHTATGPAILGGGSAHVRPGDVSLATNGVLFLDEFPEFSQAVIEALRQPLEDGCIRIARAAATVTFPAHFQLIATMNPCPCGEGAHSALCRCDEGARARYMRRLSRPILDRIDVRLYVERVEPEALMYAKQGESSEVIKARVELAREVSRQRGFASNSQLSGSALEYWAPLCKEAERLLLDKLERAELSARGLVRIRRVARTIADLDGAPEKLSDEHVAAALMLRPDSQSLRVAA